MRKTLLVVSILATLFCSTSWILSYWTYQIVGWFDQDQNTSFTVHVWSRGRVSVERRSGVIFQTYRGRVGSWMFGQRQYYVGFGGYRNVIMSHGKQKGFRFLLWVPTAVLSAFPAYHFFFLPFRRRHKRKKFGLCIRCGYDLRGSKERCPECGESFERPRLKAEG